MDRGSEASARSDEQEAQEVAGCYVTHTAIDWTAIEDSGRDDTHIVQVLDNEATLTLNESARMLAERMEAIYDMANVARRAKSEANRRNTRQNAVPNIGIGDFVLYSKHKRETKLDAWTSCNLNFIVIDNDT